VNTSIYKSRKRDIIFYRHTSRIHRFDNVRCVKWKMPQNSFCWLCHCSVCIMLSGVLYYFVSRCRSTIARQVITWDKRIKTSSAHLGRRGGERIIKLRGAGDRRLSHQTCHLFDRTKGLQSTTTAFNCHNTMHRAYQFIIVEGFPGSTFTVSILHC